MGWEGAREGEEEVDGEGGVKTAGLYEVPKLRNLKSEKKLTDGPTDRLTYTSRWSRLKILCLYTN